MKNRKGDFFPFVVIFIGIPFIICALYRLYLEKTLQIRTEEEIHRASIKIYQDKELEHKKEMERYHNLVLQYGK